MIKCKTCSKSFTKPVRRGRPPSQCDECKSGQPAKVRDPLKQALTMPVAQVAQKRARAAQKPSEPQGDTTTPTEAPKSPSEPLRAGKKASRAYVSGYCNVRHAPDIHKLCSTIGGCVCECHKEAS